MRISGEALESLAGVVVVAVGSPAESPRAWLAEMGAEMEPPSPVLRPLPQTLGLAGAVQAGTPSALAPEAPGSAASITGSESLWNTH